LPVLFFRIFHKENCQWCIRTARFSTITAEGEDWQREQPGDPLGVFLAASLKVQVAIPIASINPAFALN
jgi:hypothetical protein